MENTIARMTAAIADILADNPPSIHLYGSCAMGDFRPGWSDIDLLVLTPHPLTDAQAQQLLTLRQNSPVLHPDIQHARACEGAILPLENLTKHTTHTIVYWGTSGQRLTDCYAPDVFCLWQLHHGGRLLHGEDVRHFLPIPTPGMLHAAVADHLRTVLEHGRGSARLYAFGWLLDIARCLYTLRQDAVIAKTAAGEWALQEGLCPDAAALRLALEVRRNPAMMADAAVQEAAMALTPAIAAFAQVLQQELVTRELFPAG